MFINTLKITFEMDHYDFNDDVSPAPKYATPVLTKQPSLLARAGKLAVYCTISATMGFGSVYSASNAYSDSSKTQTMIIDDASAHPLLANDMQTKEIAVAVTNNSLEELIFPRKMSIADVRSELKAKKGIPIEIVTVGWHIPQLSMYPVIIDVKK